MSAKDLILNIAVNLGRLGRWVDEGKMSRTKLFLDETWDYLLELEKLTSNPRFEKTLKSFKESFQDLRSNSIYDKAWAEEALTWANILQHRAKLA